MDHPCTKTVSIHWLKGVESAFHSKGSTLKRTNAYDVNVTLDDVGPGVTTQRYHNNGRLIMLEVKCIKFTLDIQNSLGIIMCKFHAFQSKTEGMAASVRVFLEHPSYDCFF